MILEDLNANKWQLLKLIAKKPKSPKELSELTGYTISNISQQLKLLEAQGYLTRKRMDTGVGGRKGKDVRILYQMKEQKTYLLSIGKTTKLKQLKTDEKTEYVLNVLVNDAPLVPLLKLFCKHEDTIKHIDSLYFIETISHEIHLFVVSENIEYFRANSKLKIGNDTLVFWSHTKQEVLEGLRQKEKYFQEKIEKMKKLYDKNDFIEGLQ